MVNADLSATQAAMQSLGSKVRRGDTVVFYYSGHGVQLDGDNYLIPVDFDPKDGESTVRSHCIRAADVQSRIQAWGAGLTVLVLDACRTNPFRKDGAFARGLALMEADLGSYIALAAGPGQRASDNPDEHNGLFTKYVLQELQHPDQAIDQLFKRVKMNVFAASGGKQRPWLHGDIVGDLFLAGQAGSPPGSRTPSGVRPDFLSQGRDPFGKPVPGHAAQSLERAPRANPEDPYIYNALGAAYGRLEKWSLAVQFFSQAIDLKPDYAAAYYNRGLAYYRAGRYPLAVQDFSWAIDQEAYDPLAYSLRGKTYLSLLDYDHARADFDRALQLNPSDWAAFIGRGKVKFRQGRYEESAGDLTQPLQLRQTAEAYEMRSQVFHAMGQLARSDEDRQSAERFRASKASPAQR